MIEYLDEHHLYLVDGVIVPSVTQILHKVFPNKYKNVPKWILNNKANYGTKVHQAIEDLENGKVIECDSVYIEESIKQYQKLKDDYCIDVLEQEQMVHYEYFYAGRFDMIANINEKKCLCDIKTTAELDKDYLSWQLSMYELAYGEKFDKFYCIWLPKGCLGKLVEIERLDENKILEVIKK
jgi:hypothetical protein